MMCKKISKKREVKTCAQVLVMAQRPPSPVHLPSPVQETPPELEEMKKCVEEVEQLEEVGRSPQSLPAQQLAQMAAEVGRGGTSLQEVPTYCGRQGPTEGILTGWASKEALEVPTGDSDTLQDLPVSKEHRAPYSENLILTASL